MTGAGRQVPIRTRLALLYTALLVAALTAFGAGMYLVLRDELERSFDASLLANAEHAAGAFAQDVDASGRLRPSSRLLDQFAATGGRVIVLDPTGAELARSTSSSGGDLPISATDLAAADAHGHAVRGASVAGDQLRLAVEPVVLAGGDRVGYIAWADTTKPLLELLASVRLALLVGGSLVASLALVGGLLLSRRALRPVAEVTDTARAIALSGDFGGRVDAGPARDEVGDLALAFNEMLAALEENHQALQRFLGDASHQLRTPLTVIRANLDLLARSDLPPGEQAAILADARDEADRMGRLIRDLLSLARAESGARLEFAPVELDALLVESVRRQYQAARHVRMGVSSVEPAVIDGDRHRIHELLGILLDNAARYTPDGGRVTASLEIHEGRAVIVVEDTGIGLDAEDRARLFERLYRGRRARDLRPSGTGLGLAIASWIVEAHGGTIELLDRDGGGTIARVALPMRGR